MVDRDEVIARGKAAFLGLALGDALGATTEFMTPNEIRVKHKVHKKIIGGGWLGLKPGQVTDDTEMSLAIARSLTVCGEWNLADIADNFVSWMRSKPIDIGSTVRKGIRNYMRTGQLAVAPNEWDAGNGAAMRMAPVALYTLGCEENLQRYSLEQARLTHHHPLSDAACICVGRMTQAAMLGADRFRLHEITRELVAKHPNFKFNHYNGQASGYVVETLRTVFHYIFSTDNFEECLIGIVNQGGDADTTGAIGGMIAGAFYGYDALPHRWLRKLDFETRILIEDQAVRLVRLSPWYEEVSGAGEAGIRLKEEKPLSGC